LVVSRSSSGGNDGEWIIGAKGELASSELELVSMVSEMGGEDRKGVDVLTTEGRASKMGNNVEHPSSI
jgi:hypothetical protein